MIVHIGWEACVDSREVVAVLTRECMERSDLESGILGRMKETGRFTPSPMGERSYFLLEGGGGRRVVASAIRTPTLLDRFTHNGLKE